MKLKFTLNRNVDYDTLTDSMQLDSGTELAKLTVDGFVIYLEVRGSVRVVWNPDPNGRPTHVYKEASRFPEELMKVFKEGLDTSAMRNLRIDDNNWFEIFVDVNGENYSSEVVNLKNYNPDTIFCSLWAAYLETRWELRNETEGKTVPFGVDITCKVGRGILLALSQVQELAGSNHPFLAEVWRIRTEGDVPEYKYLGAIEDNGHNREAFFKSAGNNAGQIVINLEKKISRHAVIGSTDFFRRPRYSFRYLCKEMALKVIRNRETGGRGTEDLEYRFNENCQEKL